MVQLAGEGCKTFHVLAFRFSMITVGVPGGFNDHLGGVALEFASINIHAHDLTY